MDDEPGAAEGGETVFVLGIGILSRQEVDAAARFALALRETARGLAMVGGTKWALDVLREEIAAIEAPAKRGAGRPPQPARASDFELMIIETVMSSLPAPKLAAILHRARPGVHGATPLALEKRIKTIRTMPHQKRTAMAKAAYIKAVRHEIDQCEADGVISKGQALAVRDICRMMEGGETLSPANADLLRGIMGRLDSGIKSG